MSSEADDRRFLDAAIAQALEGRDEGGIPIGSVLVVGGRVVGEGRNRRVQDGDPIMHAEIACLQNAGRLRSYRNATLYSTLMPCYLCAGAIVQFQIPRVVVGDLESFTGARDFLVSNRVELHDLRDKRCMVLMEEFIKANPDLWKEDIGAL
ncbi:MAG TPA: nucleoside deaminase [Thermoanaerobaculia bacterium]|nr:nucleoside deaminase [Thermoanaerobaculia bacterium]